MPINIGITCLITKGGRGESTMGIRNSNLERSQVSKKGKVGLNHFLSYTHSFPPLSNQFLLTYFKSVAIRKLFLGVKNIVEGGIYPFFPPLPKLST